MILDKDSATVLTVNDWPTLADIRTGVIKSDIDEETGLTLIFMRNPSSIGDDSMVMISHAVAALRDGDMIFLSSLEVFWIPRASSKALLLRFQSCRQPFDRIAPYIHRYNLALPCFL